MLFLITFKIHEDAKLDCFNAFGSMTAADDAKDAGPNIVIVVRAFPLITHLQNFGACRHDVCSW